MSLIFYTIYIFYLIKPYIKLKYFIFSWMHINQVLGITNKVKHGLLQPSVICLWLNRHINFINWEFQVKCMSSLTNLCHAIEILNFNFGSIRQLTPNCTALNSNNMTFTFSCITYTFLVCVTSYPVVLSLTPSCMISPYVYDSCMFGVWLPHLI